MRYTLLLGAYEFKAIQQKLESLQRPTPPIPKTPKLPGL